MKTEANIRDIDIDLKNNENKTLPPHYDVTLHYEDGSEVVIHALSAQDILNRFQAHLTEDQAIAFRTQTMIETHFLSAHIQPAAYQPPIVEGDPVDEHHNERCRCVMM
ncbi:MAG: hypothetical protein A3F42_00455 [Gammaproteobacteria bacterium RIFCSPHIGHO2_12_FULL_37_34]|nr:MAG: hypothetical protein A3F42_00455 [Gammaproteobacteria bacterium RIFCSPHIGHO2_12_FULL_37_34]